MKSTAHMLERQAITNLFLLGGRAGFISGDITTLLGNSFNIISI